MLVRRMPFQRFQFIDFMKQVPVLAATGFVCCKQFSIVQCATA